MEAEGATSRRRKLSSASKVRSRVHFFRQF
jgi:hypothetical protein